MKKILIADDREAGRELIRTVLDGEGYEVIEAVDGRDAIAKAYECRPDLIVLDLQMPYLDGFAVTAALRAEPEFRRTPIVALTASAMHGDRERALDNGFTAYITKPVRLPFLRSEVIRLLSQS